MTDEEWFKAVHKELLYLLDDEDVIAKLFGYEDAAEAEKAAKQVRAAERKARRDEVRQTNNHQ